MLKRFSFTFEIGRRGKHDSGKLDTLSHFSYANYKPNIIYI